MWRHKETDKVDSQTDKQSDCFVRKSRYDLGRESPVPEAARESGPQRLRTECTEHTHPHIKASSDTPRADKQ